MTTSSETGLQVLVGILVLGPGHEAGEAQAVQQVIHRLQAQGDTELVLQDALVVVAIEGGPTLLGCGADLDASDEVGQLGPIDAERTTRSGLFLEGGGSVLIIPGDPLLSGPLAIAQGPGDLLGRSPLNREYDGLMPLPEFGTLDCIGQVLQRFECEMVLNMRGPNPLVDREQSA